MCYHSSAAKHESVNIAPASSYSILRQTACLIIGYNEVVCSYFLISSDIQHVIHCRSMKMQEH